MEIVKLVRDNIKALSPYRSARDDFKDGILLDANENSLGSPVESNLELNRYPDPKQDQLRDLIAGYRGVERDNVFVGVGSDEAIDLLIRIFCEPGSHSIIINPPTYGMYKVSARVNNVGIKEVLLKDNFQLDVDAVLAANDDQSRIVFLCSPNNPTGHSLNHEDVLRVASEFEGIVVVDEAYIDFSPEDSFSAEIRNYPNLVVMQTLSKAFGLAGIRLGIALANEEVIHYMMKIKAPYNVNALTAEKAIEAFSSIDQVQDFINMLNAEKARLIPHLQAFEDVYNILPSDANFILAQVKGAKELYTKLAEEGIIVRYRGNEPLCEDGLRITIGTKEENDQLISSLGKLIT